MPRLPSVMGEWVLHTTADFWLTEVISPRFSCASFLCFTFNPSRVDILITLITLHCLDTESGHIPSWFGKWSVCIRSARYIPSPLGSFLPPSDPARQTSLPQLVLCIWTLTVHRSPYRHPKTKPKGNFLPSTVWLRKKSPHPFLLTLASRRLPLTLQTLLPSLAIMQDQHWLGRSVNHVLPLKYLLWPVCGLSIQWDLFSNKKEGHSVRCSNVGKPWKHAPWKKPNTKDSRLCEPTSLKCPEQAHPQGWKAGEWLHGSRGRGRLGSDAKGCGVSFRGKENVVKLIVRWLHNSVNTQKTLNYTL